MEVEVFEGVPGESSPSTKGSASKHAVRNHNSVGVKRPYLHELSIDHSHYGVA
jgi:hypothetical protein